MQIGYRIIRPEDVGTQAVSFAQISLWKTAHWGIADGERAVLEAVEIAAACKRIGVRTVFHPLEYPLTGDQAGLSIPVFERLAAAADLGIIIHDEGGPAGARLSDVDARLYETHLRRISRLCPVSVENSFSSKDILWFWQRFVATQDERVSITLDIGHLESAGVDALSFIRQMPQHLMRRVRFVHMHHKGEERYGVIDHWPLVRDCKEIEALKLLLTRTPEPWVILELDARDSREVRDSIALLEELR